MCSFCLNTRVANGRVGKFEKYDGDEGWWKG
jgi:hypothetical protein